MTNNNIYFVANWKMYGDLSSINQINKLIKLSKSKIYKNTKIVYCPPYTLIDRLITKTNKSPISIGAQDCHFETTNFAFTGKISAQQIKKLGAKYVIIGHSENRSLGETDKIINRKLKSALKEKLIPIFCVGEKLKDKKINKTSSIIKKQIRNGLKGIKNFNNIIVAYEPVWAIGTGLIPKNYQIEKVVKLIKDNVNKKTNKILYGGSVNNKNILELKKIKSLNGFLIGGASHTVDKFVDIIKKTIN